VLVNVLL